jgi:Fe-S-cluster-containing hydrogenase component 2/CRP-like cAMP-binding protein
MIDEPLEDLFEQYESQYVSDLEGRLIHIDEATRDDMEEKYTVKIDGQQVSVPKAVAATDAQGNPKYDTDGLVVPRLSTVYDAVALRYRDTTARFPGPNPNNPVPVLCHVNHQPPIGVCRVCSVLTAKKGRIGEKLIPACQHPLVKDMEVHTVASEEAIKPPGEKAPVPAGEFLTRTINVLLQLLAANSLHHDQPHDNRRYRNELLDLCERFQVPLSREGGQIELKGDGDLRYRGRRHETPGKIDDSSTVIKVDHDNCILCDRCVRGCSEVKPFKIIGHTGFGNKARISFDLGVPMANSGCVSCGECAVSCPTGALTFKASIYANTIKPRDPWGDEPLKPRTVSAEELEKLPLFSGVPYAFLKWNEGAVGRVQARPGLALCKQGDYASTAFLIEKGNVDVAVNGTHVATCTPRDVIVGELACLSHQPRAADLDASKDGATVLVIKRNVLHMLQRNAQARNILGPIYRRRALDAYLGKGQLFAGLSSAQNEACIEFLSGRPDVMLTQVDPGQAVFLQGGLADSFFIIYLGHVSVSETNALGHTTVLDYLGPGRQFGEIGLLSDATVCPALAQLLPPALQGRRTATCTALDHVELVSIGRDAFRALLDAHADIRERLVETACALVEKDRRERMEVSHLLGSFTQAGLHEGQNLLVLELNHCTRCQECVKACADSHDGVTRLVLEGNRFGEYLVPSACRSCHDPVCLVGCPVDAIHRKPARPGQPKSLAIVIEDHCIGCGLCAHNCPFGSIHMYEVPADRRWPNGKRMACMGERLATNCDVCESLDGNPRCVHRCPHDAAVRMTGFELAKHVGLAPLGAAQDGLRNNLESV